jgi:hypothetical protein
MLDYEQDVEPVQQHRVHAEEVRGENAVCLGAQEFSPAWSFAARGGVDAGSLQDQPHHVPDFVRRVDGVEVVVNVRADERTEPADAEVFAATAAACDAVGWEFRRVGALEAVFAANAPPQAPASPFSCLRRSPMMNRPGIGSPLRKDGWEMEIDLADAVAVVRDQLLEAAARGTGENIGFLVGPVEMEFTVELKADAKAKAGFKAWVVSGDAEAGMSRGRTQRVKIMLTPRSADGADLLIYADGAPLAGRGDVSAHQGR